MTFSRRILRQLGGDLRCNTRVEKIEYQGSTAPGSVLTDKGEVFSGDSFIYAGDYKRLVSSILGP